MSTNAIIEQVRRLYNLRLNEMELFLNLSDYNLSPIIYVKTLSQINNFRVPQKGSNWRILYKKDPENFVNFPNNSSYYITNGYRYLLITCNLCYVIFWCFIFSLLFVSYVF